MVNPGSPQFSVQTSSGLITLTAPVAISTDTWTHLAATYDGTNMNLYINGDLVATAAHTRRDNTESFIPVHWQDRTSQLFYSGRTGRNKSLGKCQDAGGNTRENAHPYPGFRQP